MGNSAAYQSILSLLVVINFALTSGRIVLRHGAHYPKLNFQEKDASEMYIRNVLSSQIPQYNFTAKCDLRVDLQTRRRLQLWDYNLQRKLQGGANGSICSPNPCQNSGNCTVNGDDYKCDCPTGYSGKNCTTTVNFNCTGSGSGESCENGGTPIGFVYTNGTHNLTQGCSCLCAEGYEGSRCEQNIDDCASSPCKNEGTCTDLLNGFNCTCSDRFYGERCELSNICTLGANQSACQHGGLPVGRKTSPAGCSCDCSNAQGFIGSHCQVEQFWNCSFSATVGWENASEFQVRHHTLQRAFGNATRVECRYLSGGDHILCPSFAQSASVMQSSILLILNVSQSFDLYNVTRNVSRITKSHMTEQRTDLERVLNDYFRTISTRHNLALSMSFLEHELSYPILHNSTITCPDCQNGGSPIPGSDKSCTCSCLPGYSGMVCETNIDECAINPCKNNATCQDLVNDYNCNCSGNYTGKDCEIDSSARRLQSPTEYKCSTSANGEVCENGGVPRGSIQNNGTHNFTHQCECKCADGFWAPTCSNVDHCFSDPCGDRGTCVRKLDGYTCACHEGFQGLDCTSEGRFNISGRNTAILSINITLHEEDSQVNVIEQALRVRSGSGGLEVVLRDEVHQMLHLTNLAPHGTTSLTVQSSIPIMQLISTSTTSLTSPSPGQVPPQTLAPSPSTSLSPVGSSRNFSNVTNETSISGSAQASSPSPSSLVAIMDTAGEVTVGASCEYESDDFFSIIWMEILCAMSEHWQVTAIVSSVLFAIIILSILVCMGVSLKKSGRVCFPVCRCCSHMGTRCGPCSCPRCCA